jgi:hypothetical protein
LQVGAPFDTVKIEACLSMIRTIKPWSSVGSMSWLWPRRPRQRAATSAEVHWQNTVYLKR